MRLQKNSGTAMAPLRNVKRILIVLCIVAVGWVKTVSAQQQLLENPQPESFQSGISTISGWVCDALRVHLLIDGNIRADAVYGTGREDTRAACGDTNNGFSVLVNWNDLSEGIHTVALCVDDVCGNSIRVAVHSYGESFLRGRSGIIPVCTNRTSPPFPTPTIFIWQESSQNWAIGLTPACAQISIDCSPIPPSEPARGVCTTLLECCRTQ